MEANPHSADAFYLRAKVLMVMNRNFEAAESLKTSFQLDPQKRTDFEQEFPGARSIREFRTLFKK
jgi:hypothetical protein